MINPDFFVGLDIVKGVIPEWQQAVNKITDEKISDIKQEVTNRLIDCGEYVQKIILLNQELHDGFKEVEADSDKVNKIEEMQIETQHDALVFVDDALKDVTTYIRSKAEDLMENVKSKELKYMDLFEDSQKVLTEYLNEKNICHSLKDFKEELFDQETIINDTLQEMKKILEETNSDEIRSTVHDVYLKYKQWLEIKQQSKDVADRALELISALMILMDAQNRVANTYNELYADEVDELKSPE